MAAIDTLARYTAGEGRIMDASQPSCRAGCSDATYCLFVVCGSYYTVCLTDEEVHCIRGQVRAGYHPIPVYLAAFARLGQGRYAPPVSPAAGTE